MNEVSEPKRKRKVLSLKLQPRHEARKERRELEPSPPKFLTREESFFLVWNQDGDTPKRIYPPEEITKALHHAKELAEKTGKRFHVFRSWRAFEPAPDGE